VRTAGVNVIVSGLDFRQHLWNQLGRILQVGIEHHQDIAADVIDPRAQGDFLPVVARQFQVSNSTVDQ
jgi:hypothetical protein